jgi:hypothetical protein
MRTDNSASEWLEGPFNHGHAADMVRRITFARAGLRVILVASLQQADEPESFNPDELGTGNWQPALRTVIGALRAAQRDLSERLGDTPGIDLFRVLRLLEATDWAMWRGGSGEGVSPDELRAIVGEAHRLLAPELATAEAWLSGSPKSPEATPGKLTH